MTIEQRNKIQQFIEDWKTRGDEKSDTQLFWISLLRDVFGIERPESFIQFEKRVKIGNISFIDAYIPSTRVLIEQKSADVDLSKPIRQSDGRELTPYQQALRYDESLPFSQRNKWIIICNFRQFHIYNRETPNEPPIIVNLEELEANYSTLYCIVDQTQTEIYKETQLSIQAGELVGRLYDALLAQYHDPTNPSTLKSLNILCVRLVFCLYAEDAGLFNKNQFYNYFHDVRPDDARRALIDLFEVLNTPKDKRDPYISKLLSGFPYVDGGLFETADIEIPLLNQDIVYLISHDCSLNFNWSNISPTIFGAVFESTLNPETRRTGGMHYTSIENIHRVIDPLFLTELKSEQEDIFAERSNRTRQRRLQEFHAKLSRLTFFDPACGSGNFLTETYISLRKLENDVIRELFKGGFQSFSADVSPIQVNINHFYGIEINDFAVAVAKTALWIAESQTLQQTEDIIGKDLQFFPLRSYAHIVEGNALQLDWENFVPKDELNYIMGNSPYVGYGLQTNKQKKEVLSVFVNEAGKPCKKAGKIDYVSAWYYKASQLIQNTDIHCAFVSTNSITQGEQVASVWKPLFERFDIEINFAWRTFKWESETKNQAAVHCVIIGFSTRTSANPIKTLFENEKDFQSVDYINPYLCAAPTLFIEKRLQPLCAVPEMITGNRPADGGHLIIEAKDYPDFIKKEPLAIPYIKKLVGAKEYLNNTERWCLWLVDIDPAKLLQMPEVLKRVKACRQNRLSAPDEGRRLLADTPTVFRETNNPKRYIIIPSTSSENRSYIPMGFLDCNTISTNANLIIPKASLYHLGVLTSSVHMAWMRAVCGRLKSDYRYSKEIVYNNFPWPTVTDEQKATIKSTAQGILDARKLFHGNSLATMYNNIEVLNELRKAHQLNDQAVLKAYKFPKNISESDIVARLMKMYQKLTEEK